uniref:C-5 cytosine-specific DNA methylase n=1 Tax=Pithovirus LCPAC201 TaxID=2506591 RepID=A0A481Z4Z4_9VIRU|nr:MAG: C-5 cytosine-specific DNA methylase [Pithovirus LCPAC201]
MKPTLLDLFCGAGGASVGYDRAGFDVTGVDIRPQPHYPFKFIQGDAVEFISKHGKEYDVIHASPPCQGYSKHTRPNSKHVHYSKGSDEPRLIDTVRRLIPNNKPYIIENVVGARNELIQPILLCGTMFNLPITRHRLFEVNFNFKPPEHPKCRGVAKKYSIDHGIDYRDMSVCGKSRRKGCIDTWKTLTGNQWMVCAHELSESIPWAYTKLIGTALITQLINLQVTQKPKSGPLPIRLLNGSQTIPKKNEIIFSLQSTKLRTISLFSGIGGFELGLAPWVDVCLLAEKDSYCKHVLEKQFPGIPIVDDVRNVTSEMIEKLTLLGGPIECILAGFPCQDISQAGKGVGLTGKRSGLINEVFRLTNSLRPNYIFLENVQLLRKRGLSEVVSRFAKFGYDIRWITLSVVDVGGFHQRKRMFILAWKRTSIPIFPLINQKFRVDWSVEPEIPRVLDHLATKSDRQAIRALGNSIVPAQAHEAFIRLTAENFLPGEIIADNQMPANGEYLQSTGKIDGSRSPSNGRRSVPSGKIYGRKSCHVRLPKQWPKTMQRYKTTHSLPTPTASDAIIRKPTNTQKSRAFRPGVNKSVSLNRWVSLFPTRETIPPPIDEEGYLINNESFSGGECPNPEWITWVMGYPPGWLREK